MMAYLVQGIVRHHLPGVFVVVTTPWEVIIRELNSVSAGDSVEHTQAFRHDLFADSVSGNYGNPIVFGRGHI
jgi:hypothetical protein